MKNFWLDRRKERVEKPKDKYIYPKALWAVVQKKLNKRKATGP